MKKMKYNAIPKQEKTSSSRIEPQEWNYIINVLKEQANHNSSILEDVPLLRKDLEKLTTEEMEILKANITYVDEQKTDKVETRQVGETIITYDSGVIVSMSRDNVVESIEYDINGEVEKVTSTYADDKVYEETYTKDVNGNITKIMKVEVI